MKSSARMWLFLTVSGTGIAVCFCESLSANLWTVAGWALTCITVGGALVFLAENYD